MGDSVETILADNRLARRNLLIGGGIAMAGIAAGLAATSVPAMAAPAASSGTLAVRSLLSRASRDAIGDLSKPDGFWDSSVARINLPTLFARPPAARRGARTASPVAPAVRGELQHKLNTLAQAALPRVQAEINRSIARLLVRDPAITLAGGPTAATTLLRRAMGPRLINAMIPPLSRALRDRQDPTIMQAMTSLKGVSINNVAQALANEADNAIWYQIGASEAAIRRDPAFRAG